jgi:hypothetical protein
VYDASINVLNSQTIDIDIDMEGTKDLSMPNPGLSKKASSYYSMQYITLYVNIRECFLKAFLEPRSSIICTGIKAKAFVYLI